MNSPADHVRLGYLAFVEQARLAIGACRNYNLLTFPVAGCSSSWLGLLWAGNKPKGALFIRDPVLFNRLSQHMLTNALLLPGMSAEQAFI